MLKMALALICLVALLCVNCPGIDNNSIIISEPNSSIKIPNFSVDKSIENNRDRVILNWDVSREHNIDLPVIGGESLKPTKKKEKLSIVIGKAANKLENELYKGKILFIPPKKMTVDKPEYISLNLTKNNICGGEDILLGKYMTAELRGTNFEIVPLSHAGQQIPDKGLAIWEWRVTPTSPGDQILELTVSIRTKIPNGGEEIQDYPTYKNKVVVNVDYGYWIGNYITKNWIQLLTSFLAGCASVIAILVSIFGEDFRKMVKRRSKR
jgi:hypothetical protein